MRWRMRRKWRRRSSSFFFSSQWFGYVAVATHHSRSCGGVMHLVVRLCVGVRVCACVCACPCARARRLFCRVFFSRAGGRHLPERAADDLLPTGGRALHAAPCVAAIAFHFVAFVRSRVRSLIRSFVRSLISCTRSFSQAVGHSCIHACFH